MSCCYDIIRLKKPVGCGYVDVLQIPAFLCRQTDLLVAAAETGRVVNIKKGQFLSPEAMQFALQKVVDAGNRQVAVTERGTTFGYQDLVVDFRGIPEMQKFGFPVILDVTHSLQKPNQTSGVTGGLPQLIETMARAGVATGVDGLFMETHPEPSKAKSDGANMLRLDLLEGLLSRLVAIRQVLNELNRIFLCYGKNKHKNMDNAGPGIFWFLYYGAGRCSRHIGQLCKDRFFIEPYMGFFFTADGFYRLCVSCCSFGNTDE